MLELILSPLFLYSFLAALLVGVSAPVVGTYLVHRRLAMLGDGIGHVALTGVAVGWLVGSLANLSPVDKFAVPGAIIASIGAAVIIELVRRSGRTSADVVLALLFYGGIAAGVVFIGLAGGSSTQLNSYLFGSLATVSLGDLILIVAMAIGIFAIGIGLRPLLFSITNDEDFARSSGLPVNTLSMLVAVMSAVTVAVSMRVVGALLVSAIMVIPVATAQLFATSFKATMGYGMLIGGVVSVLGLAITFQVNISPGATIVVLAVIVYAVTFMVRSLLEKSRRVSR
ncbi:metal ABC transporter permease [Actinomyces minihominis]|uniref:metal ABC transporter permease n=1 Tax=Actinomyces minihominis TaxID=2002838 RepID=UPI000C083524|nr:metal ABC transporter permease [Actinomyces minihominis]